MINALNKRLKILSIDVNISFINLMYMHLFTPHAMKYKNAYTGCLKNVASIFSRS